MDRDQLKKDLQDVLDRGINSLAICCAHSYTYVKLLFAVTCTEHSDYCEFVIYRFCSHEQDIGSLAKEMGFSYISLSSRVMPMIRMVPRGYTGMYINIHYCNVNVVQFTVLSKKSKKELLCKSATVLYYHCYRISLLLYCFYCLRKYGSRYVSSSFKLCRTASMLKS